LLHVHVLKEVKLTLILNLSLKVEMPRSVAFFNANKGYAQFQLEKK